VTPPRMTAPEPRLAPPDERRLMTQSESVCGAPCRSSRGGCHDEEDVPHERRPRSPRRHR
jgi:hypothetical protein